MKPVQKRVKKNKQHSPIWPLAFLFCLFVALSYAVPEQKSHSCVDPSHMNCDGICSCDGYGCPPLSEIKLVKDSVNNIGKR